MRVVAVPGLTNSSPAASSGLLVVSVAAVWPPAAGSAAAPPLAVAGVVDRDERLAVLTRMF